MLERKTLRGGDVFVFRSGGAGAAGRVVGRGEGVVGHTAARGVVAVVVCDFVFVVGNVTLPVASTFQNDLPKTTNEPAHSTLNSRHSSFELGERRACHSALLSDAVFERRHAQFQVFGAIVHGAVNAAGD